MGDRYARRRVQFATTQQVFMSSGKIGAGEGIRTLDPDLGKVISVDAR
jgi:hypothetical protein